MKKKNKKLREKSPRTKGPRVSPRRGRHVASRPRPDNRNSVVRPESLKNRRWQSSLLRGQNWAQMTRQAPQLAHSSSKLRQTQVKGKDIA